MPDVDIIYKIFIVVFKYGTAYTRHTATIRFGARAVKKLNFLWISGMSLRKNA